MKYGGRDISKVLRDWQLSRAGAEKAFSAVCPNSEKEGEGGRKAGAKGRGDDLHLKDGF